MNLQLKDLSDQVIVITGASSGIGLVTARMAARRGACVVLNARNEEALRQVANEINAEGGEAVHVAGDVGKLSDVQMIAYEAIRRFGGFDTWVNNAGVSIYGPVLDQSLADQRRLFDTNYWGVVHGSIVACTHLRKRGGALINIGSVLSDVAIPIQGTYCATKHAVKGYTDALRLELDRHRITTPVVLVAHSYGGFVATIVAATDPRIAGAETTRSSASAGVFNSSYAGEKLRKIETFGWSIGRGYMSFRAGSYA